MDLDSYFSWHVVRGRLGLFARPTGIDVEIDPEGSRFCVLNHQDAGEIARLITQMSFRIWGSFEDKTDEALGESGTLTFDAEQGVWSWPTPAGPLRIGPNDEGSLIRIGGETLMEFHLRVRQAVEIVQILEHLVSPGPVES